MTVYIQVSFRFAKDQCAVFVLSLMAFPLPVFIVTVLESVFGVHGSSKCKACVLVCRRFLSG